MPDEDPSDLAVSQSPPEPADLPGLALRTVALVAEALARFQLLLQRNRYRLNAHEERIADTIRLKSEGLLDGLFNSVRLLSYGRHREVSSVARHDYWKLREYHRYLRHLSVPMVLPESITFINSAWAALLEAPLPDESKKAMRHEPALCLSDLMQPSEHSYEDLSVVALSKIDHANALSWPLLLHELGHNAIRDLEFEFVSDLQDEVAKKALREWLIEIGCDLIGLRMAGPAYLAPFIMHTLTEKSLFASTSKHPSPYARADFLLGKAEEWGVATSLVSELHKLIETRSALELRIQTDGLSGTKMVCFYCGASHGTIQSLPRTDRHLQSFVAQFDKRLPIPDYNPERYKKAEQIAGQLGRGMLAGSSHNTPAAAAAFEQFDRIRDEPSADKKDIDQAFLQARDSVCDEPNNLFDIVTAAWIRYFDESRVRVDILIPAKTPAEFRSRWEQFVIRVSASDELLRASIESADFHDKIKGLRTYVK